MELEDDTSAPGTLNSKCSPLDPLKLHAHATDTNVSDIQLANEDQRLDTVHDAAQATTSPLHPQPQDMLDDSGIEPGRLHAENLSEHKQLQQKRRGIFPKVATNSMRAWLFRHLEVCTRFHSR